MANKGSTSESLSTQISGFQEHNYSTDKIFEDLPPLDSFHDHIFNATASESELIIKSSSALVTEYWVRRLECPIFNEVGGHMNVEHSSSPNHPRRNGSSSIGANTKGKEKQTPKKSHRPSNFSVGESSEAPQAEANGNEKGVEQLLNDQNYNVWRILKILGDRVNRLEKNDEIADKTTCIDLLWSVLKYQVTELVQPILDSLEHMRKKWPARSDLADIKITIKQMQKEEHSNTAGMAVSKDMKRRMQDVEVKIKNAKRQRDEVPCIAFYNILHDHEENRGIWKRI